MSGSTALAKSNNQTKKQISEARLRFYLFAFLVGYAAIATAWGWHMGNDLAAAAAGSTGATLGVILGFGAFLLICRRFGCPRLAFEKYGWAIYIILFPVMTSGREGAPFIQALVCAFFPTVAVLALAVAIRGPLERYDRRTRSRQSKKAPPPQSDHLLYDADVDAATGPGVVGELGVR